MQKTKMISIKTLLFVMFMTTSLFSQKVAEYGKIPSGKNFYDQYITKAGKTISVGDTIIIGMPSSDNGFNHITQLGQKGAVFLSDRAIEVQKIKTFKDKRFHQRAYICFKGYGLALVDIDYELALKTGEIEEPTLE